MATGTGRISDVAFSRDGRLVAVTGDRGYGVFDAQSGNTIKRDSTISNPARVAFSPQGTLLAVGSNDGAVRIIDLRTGDAREAARHKRPVTAVAFGADGRLGASGDAQGGILLWDAESGPLGPLADGGHKEDILLLAFSATGLVSASKDSQVVAWDTAAKRPIRRGTMQSSTSGRVFVPAAGGVDPTAEKLVLSTQLVGEQRGGAVASGDTAAAREGAEGAGQRARAGGRINGPLGVGVLARPTDVRRENYLAPYVVATGISPALIFTNDFAADRVALGPGGCFAFFTSNYRDQARLHVWGLVDKGEGLAQVDLPRKASAMALHPAGNIVAVGAENGELRLWTVSGATKTDCDAYTAKPLPAAGPSISLGDETSPLIEGGSQRIAVAPYETTGVDATLGNGIAEMVTGQLANNPQLVVVERAAINAIVKEMELQRSGLTSTDAAVRIGRGVNARTVLFGSIRRFGESTYVITTRAVDIETQRILGQREVTCENCREGDLPRAIATLRRVIAP